MTYINTIIKGTGIYHPENEVDNLYFINYFAKNNTSIEGLLKHLGRDKRFFNETRLEGKGVVYCIL